MDKMTQEPCDFVKLVLQRMDTNPEEFEVYGRWNSLCRALEVYAGAGIGTISKGDQNVLWAYDQFEIDLMVAKYREIYRDREYKNMLKSILMGNDTKMDALMRDAKIMASAGNNINAYYQNITPRQLFADTTTTGAFSHVGTTIANTATTTANSQIGAVDYTAAIEAKMQGFKRG